jgi:hypothetical protein
MEIQLFSPYADISQSLVTLSAILFFFDPCENLKLNENAMKSGLVLNVPLCPVTIPNTRPQGLCIHLQYQGSRACSNCQPLFLRIYPDKGSLKSLVLA